mmetsp:Transcript_3006/g.10807  ORF Transcript_3006/g.10807 Transcript_3006/m.10807 type:complete len:210 (+) Transcript_3006:304-933(+)
MMRQDTLATVATSMKRVVTGSEMYRSQIAHRHSSCAAAISSHHHTTFAKCSTGFTSPASSTATVGCGVAMYSSPAPRSSASSTMSENMRFVLRSIWISLHSLATRMVRQMDSGLDFCDEERLAPASSSSRSPPRPPRPPRPLRPPRRSSSSSSRPRPPPPSSSSSPTATPRGFSQSVKKTSTLVCSHTISMTRTSWPMKQSTTSSWCAS